MTPARISSNASRPPPVGQQSPPSRHTQLARQSAFAIQDGADRSRRAGDARGRAVAAWYLILLKQQYVIVFVTRPKKSSEALNQSRGWRD
jgi:hypothetical protein